MSWKHPLRILTLRALHNDGPRRYVRSSICLLLCFNNKRLLINALLLFFCFFRVSFECAISILSSKSSESANFHQTVIYCMLLTVILQAEITSAWLRNLVKKLKISQSSSCTCYYKRKIFSTAVLTLKFDLDLRKVNLWNSSQMFYAKFHEHLTFTFREITTSEPTNQRTNKHSWS